MKKVFRFLITSLVGFIEAFSMAPSVGNLKLTGHFAKVKYGEMIAGLRGSINGTTHSRNRFGDYMRNRSIPTNPNTSAQSAVRSRLSALASGFRSLTAAQIAAWNSAVADFPTVNVFGDVRKLTGLQLYVGVNSNILNGGGSQLSAPPLPEGAPAVSGLDLTLNITGSVGTLGFDPDPVPADHALVIDATRPLSPGISNPGSAYRQIAIEAAAGTSPVDIWAAYVAKFGSPAEGQKVFARARLINLLTGEVSQKVSTSTLVANV